VIITSALTFLDSDVVAGSIQLDTLGCKDSKNVYLEPRGVIDNENPQVLHEFIDMTDTLSLADFTYDKIID